MRHRPSAKEREYEGARRQDSKSYNRNLHMKRRWEGAFAELEWNASDGTGSMLACSWLLLIAYDKLLHSMVGLSGS